MNSRDAAFDESLKEIIEATAAEAAAYDAVSVTSTGNRDGRQGVDDEVESGPSNRKKRKRSEDDRYVLSFRTSFHMCDCSCTAPLRNGRGLHRLPLNAQVRLQREIPRLVKRRYQVLLHRSQDLPAVQTNVVEERPQYPFPSICMQLKMKTVCDHPSTNRME